MGKSRKQTASRSDMLLGNYTYRNGRATVNGASELGEEDVWSTVDDMFNGDDHGSRGEWSPRAAAESNGSFGGYMNRRQLIGRSAHHSRRSRQAGGLSLVFDDSGKTASPRILHQFRGQDAPSPRVLHMATSAPVNVPDWSKIYRVNSDDGVHDHDSDDGVHDHDSDMVPPHEYLARSQNSNAHSVFEGVGRTLKGRDWSRVRDAVWSQTGFDG